MTNLEEQINSLILKGCITPPSIRDTDPGFVCWAQPTGLVIAVIAEISNGGIKIWINKSNIVPLSSDDSWMVLARANPTAIIWQPDPSIRKREIGVSDNAQVSVFTKNVSKFRDSQVLATFDVA